MYSWDHLKSYMPEYGDRIIINKESPAAHTGLNLSTLELKILNVLTEPLPVGEVIRRVASAPAKGSRP